MIIQYPQKIQPPAATTTLIILNTNNIFIYLSVSFCIYYNIDRAICQGVLGKFFKFFSNFLFGEKLLDRYNCRKIGSPRTPSSRQKRRLCAPLIRLPSSTSCRSHRPCRAPKCLPRCLLCTKPLRLRVCRWFPLLFRFCKIFCYPFFVTSLISGALALFLYLL